MHNYIEGQWRSSGATETLPVVNPATGEELGRTPLSPAAEVDQAARAAAAAFPAWRRVPVGDRIQYLFRLKPILEDNIEDLARTITMEAGKTLAESRGEMRRAIENVEVACGAPTMIQGYNSEDIASGIDEVMIRQPLGVTAIIAPFNFPGMKIVPALAMLAIVWILAHATVREFLVTGIVLALSSFLYFVRKTVARGE